MATLYIDRRHMALRREGRRLLLYREGRAAGSVPVAQVERVVVHRQAELDAGVLGLLAEEGIGMAVINPRNPDATAHLLGRRPGDVARRLGQLQRYHDGAWRRAFAARLVARKLHNQRALLARARRVRPELRRPLTIAIDAIGERLASLPRGGPPPEVASTRGHEGAGAAAYFRGLATLFPESLGFRGRNRRPPRDPVNACLSLGYTLLHAEGVQAAHAAGLDPLLGYFHEPAHGRASLAADLVEPLRPRVDEWVWGLFRERQLDAGRFFENQGAVLLDKEGRKIFYGDYERAARPWRRWLRRLALGLARGGEALGLAVLEQE